MVILFTTLSAVAVASSRDDAVAKVTVYKQVTSTGVAYNYAVTNKGDRRIIGVQVGLDYYRSNPELQGAFPAIVSPTGWAGRVITTEELSNFNVSWDGDTGGVILPGQTSGGFRVIVPADSAAYLTSHWTVIFDGAPTYASSALQPISAPIDSVPPQITVSLSPNKIWPINNRMTPITATIIVSDDRDPNPSVRLESIACNECVYPANDISGATIGTDDRNFSVRAFRLGKRKDGRVYAVTYSATDAAGNSTTATVTVRIPHDQRR